MKHTATQLLICAALSGCAPLGPNYSTPKMNLASNFFSAPAQSNIQSQTLAAFEQWWEFFRDPTLGRLVWHGLSENLEVAAAMERLREAEKALEKFGLESQATGDVELAAGRERASGTIDNVANASIRTSFTFDVFGAVRRSQEQAIAIKEARDFEIGVVRLTLLSSLVESYIRARYFQEAAAITRSTIASRRKLLGQVNIMRRAENATVLEVEQARTLLATSEATLPPLEAGFDANVFRISTLLASPSDPVMSLLRPGAAQPRPHGSTSVGIPADLLRNRPDVRRAERELAAATAAIGIAEAQLYPSLRLDGTITLGDDKGWNFGPRLTLPVLGRKRLNADRNIAMSRARQAELAWRQTVMQAIEEVQTALSECRHYSRQVQAHRAALRPSQRLLTMSRESYQRGESTLLDVINAEISLSDTQLSLAAARRDYAIAWASVQVSAGKGWGDMEQPEKLALK